MDNTKKQKAKLMFAVRRLVVAEVEHSWRGAGDPSQVPAIKKELKSAKARYKRALTEIFEGPTNG